MLLVRILGATRLLLNAAIQIVNRLSYAFTEPKHTESDQKVKAHLIVVKNKIYASAAYVCIESFLYWNSQAQAIIHTDAQTHEEVVLKVKKLNKNLRDRVSVLNDQLEVANDWQDSKLNLILSLTGSSDIFMDSDLRWNASLPKLSKPKGITFFVEEFTFDSVEDYRKIFDYLKVNHHLTKSMKNTSFVCWNGYVLSDEDKTNLKKFQNDYRLFIRANSQLFEYPDNLIRLSEQVTLSVAGQNALTSYLKLEDKRFDGSFVESSYLGSTGGQFSIFGILGTKIGKPFRFPSKLM